MPDLRTQTSQEQADLFDERAAIVEDGTGVPRDWAEAFARLDLMAQQQSPDERWHQLMDDAGRFLDRWGVDAARLGWSAIDVFGVDTDHADGTSRPTGLVPLINGGTVESIAEDRATIRMSDGGSVVYLRRPRAGLPSHWEHSGGVTPPPGDHR